MPAARSRGCRASPRNRGTRLPIEKSQSLVPPRVRICVMLVENRPYSAANGFAMTSTESTACVGRSRSKSPVDGSIRLALLICSAPWVGCPPLMRNRPFAIADDPRQQRQQAPEIVPLERRGLEQRSRQHVAHRHRLDAVGGRRRVGAHLDARQNKRQLRVENHLRRLVRAHDEHRGIAVDEARSGCRDDVPAWRAHRER